MEYIFHLLILISIFSILALGLNLVVGYTGILSVTHAAFYGIGAYATAILMRNIGMNFFLAAIIAILVTMLASFVIGVVLSKFRDDYFALGSLGFNIIVYSIMLNWQLLTRGPLGIPGITRPSIGGFQFSENILFLILILVVVAFLYYFSRWITRSSFGRVLKAIREDERAIQVFGYNTWWYKLTVFVIGAGMASIAGSFYASYISFIDPGTFVLFESIFLLAVIIFGGLANNKGAIIGAVALILIPELLRFVGFPNEVAAQMRQVIFGLLLIILMLYRPQGLIGEYKL
jgi:branched-chain amino acid transport system permease protein